MPSANALKDGELGVLANGNCRTTLYYIAHDSPAPRRVMTDGPLPAGDIGEVQAKIDPRIVEISNGRDKDLNLNLINNGLQLVPQPTKMTTADFYDNDKIQSVFYPECEAAIKANLPGISGLVIFDHIVRNHGAESNKKTIKDGEKVKGPVMFAHNDYTAMSAHRRIEELSKTKEEGGSTTAKEVILDPSEVKDLQNKRYIYLNVWRNIADYPVRDFPLAVCDGQTVEKDDLVPMDLVYTDRVGEVCQLKHREGHKWFYFPEMLKNEAMLLKCFDSDDNSGRWTGHSAFGANPPEGTFKPRQSIEVRTIAFFDVDE